MGAIVVLSGCFGCSWVVRGVVGLGRKSYLGSAESHLPFFFFFALVGVRGMNEGILFQRLHHKNTKFCKKNPVLSFLVVSTRKF